MDDAGSLDVRILQLTRESNFAQANLAIGQLQATCDKDLPVDDAMLTAAHYSAMSESGGDTLLLLVRRHGSDCLSRPGGDLGRTPLQLACQAASGKTVLSLATAVVRDGRRSRLEIFGATDSQGNNGLHFAAGNLLHPDCLLRLLDELGSDCELLRLGNQAGRTPTMVACDQQGPEALAYLTRHLPRECFALVDRNGNTAVHFAALRHPYCLVALVGRIGPDCLGVQNACGVTPLQLAMSSISDSSSQASAELANVAESRCILAVNRFGDTAVHFAARAREHADTLRKFVVKLGPSCLATRNQQARTPLHFACAAQSPSVVVKLARQPGARQLFAIADDSGNTALHCAARKEDSARGQVSRSTVVTLVQLIDVFGPECVRVRNHEGNTPLHIACGNLSPDAIKQLAGKIVKDWFTAGDANGTNAVHYAACNTSHAGTLLTLVDLLGPGCLSVGNNESKTPMHLACANQGFADIQKLMQKIADKRDDSSQDQTWSTCCKTKHGTPGVPGEADPLRRCIHRADQSGNNSMHYAALNRKHADILLKLTGEFGFDCLCHRNQEGKTPLHIAFGVHSAEIVEKLVGAVVHLKESAQCLNSADDDGNTVAHYAARSADCSNLLLDLCRTMGPEIMHQANVMGVTPLHLAAQFNMHEPEKIDALKEILGVTFEKHLDSKDNSGRNIVFYACLGHNYNLLANIDPTHIALKRTDASGNSLLHALFLAKWYLLSELQMPHFFNTMTLLLRAGIDPLDENNLRQNCLHSSELYGYSLRNVLTAVTEADNLAELRRHMKSMLLNSEGVHAAHVFFGRYHTSHFLQALSQLAGVTSQQLIDEPVSKGHLKGATCMHFACEAGNQDNIQFLLRHDQKLSARTVSGQSCVDFAFDKDKVDRVLRAAKLAATEQLGDNKATLRLVKRQAVLTILPLIDPPMRAVRLPDETSAHRLAATISDLSVRSDIAGGRAVMRGLALDASMDAGSGGSGQRADLLILHRAMELDSTKIMRCLLKLDLLKEETSDDYSTFLHLKALGSKDPETRAVFLSRFPRLTEFLRHWHHGGGAAVSIIEIGTFFEKTAVLPDLLITRQLDLIPSCLIVLLHLRLKIVSKRGRHEQLKELKRKVLNALVNALDQLFVNGNEREQGLLFSYLSGSFKPRGSSAAESSGPKFPCRIAENAFKEAGDSDYSRTMKVKEFTVMQLMENLDSGDIFATDCVSQFAKQEWSTKRKTMFHFDASPMSKLIVHAIAFVLFLLYYAWFVTDFNTTFESIVPDLVLLAYALSFTAQEVKDIHQKRRLAEFNPRPNQVIRLPLYFRDVLNVFDILALAFMWIGLIWKLSIHQDGWQASTVHPCQMVLCTGFLLWGFRSISVLSYFEKIGPVTAMLKNLLLRDLLPFLAILLVIFYTFGVFYFNLLFPVGQSTQAEREANDYTEKVFREVFLLPASMLFTYYEMLSFEPSNGSNQAIGSVANPAGRSWFNGLLMFLFMLIVNIVLVNLLIALFNLTVSRMSGRALGTWRQKRFQMLREYQSISTLPPPLSFLNYLLRFFLWLHQRRVAVAQIAQEPVAPWYRNVGSYPADYVDFLKFQALQLRLARPNLLQEVAKNRGEVEALMAHTENSLSSVHRELDETVRELDSRLLRLESRASRQSQRVRGLHRKMDQLLEALRPKDSR